MREKVKNKIYKIVLHIGLICTFLYGCTTPNPSKVSKSPNNQNRETTELQYTKEEEKAMNKWKNKTPDELFTDALDGDAAALYMMGLCYLCGQMDLPINIENANEFFSAAASLGFPPAIEQLYKQHLEENNIFLFIVYLNLTASSGHSEFIMTYHKIRDTLLEKFTQNGHALAKRTELIAAGKKIKISETIKNLKKIKKSEDRQKFVLDLILSNKGITQEDKNLGMDYWSSIYNPSLSSEE